MDDPQVMPEEGGRPARAFTKGAGVVFQGAGVVLFVLSMFVCCASGLLSKEAATRGEWRERGWRWTAETKEADYSVQRAVTIGLAVLQASGLAMAGLGLGMQADSRRAPMWAAALTGLATVYWAVHVAFAITGARSVVGAILCATLVAAFGILCALAVGAVRETWREPPPEEPGRLPAGFEVPYSHLHKEPPEVRLAREVAERKARLEVERKEIEALEERIRRRKDEGV